MAVNINGIWVVPSEVVAPPVPGTVFPLAIPETTLTKKVAINYTKPASMGNVLYDYSMGYSFPMKITRLSEIGTSLWPTGNYVQAGYPNRQAWNTDGTLLKFGNMTLFNGNSPYSYIRTIPGSNYYSLWSNTDPNKLWQFAQAGEVKIYDYAANTSTSWFTLASLGYGTVTSMSVGYFEGAIDDNDVYTILNFIEGGTRHNLLVNLQTKTVIWDKPDTNFATTEGNIDAIRISGDGTEILVCHNSPKEALVYDRATGNLIRRNLGSGSHADIIPAPSGSPRYVTRLGPLPELYNIANGVSTDLFPSATYYAAFGSSSSGGHTTRMQNKPGWEHISLIDGTVDEYIFQVKLDGSYTVQKFCHSRCDPTGVFGAHSTPNRTGTKSMFESNWGSAANNSEMYMCEVPTEAELIALGIFL